MAEGKGEGKEREKGGEGRKNMERGENRAGEVGGEKQVPCDLPSTVLKQ